MSQIPAVNDSDALYNVSRQVPVVSATDPDTRATMNVSPLPAVEVSDNSDANFTRELDTSMNGLHTLAIQDGNNNTNDRPAVDECDDSAANFGRELDVSMNGLQTLAIQDDDNTNDTGMAMNVSQLPAVEVTDDFDANFTRELDASMNGLHTLAIQDGDNTNDRHSRALMDSALSSEYAANEQFPMIPVKRECMTVSVLSLSRCSTIDPPDTGRVGEMICLGICGHSDDISCLMCARCFDILIWGFRVSCVILVMMTWTVIRTGEFFKTLDVFDDAWGWTHFPITLGDDVIRSLLGSKAYAVISPYVMMRHRAVITRYGFPWQEDNGRARACCASLDLSPIRIGGRFGWLGNPVLRPDWMDVQPVDGGPVRMRLRIGYKGDSHSQDESSDAAPFTKVHDISRVFQFFADCLTGFATCSLIPLLPRIGLWVIYEFRVSGTFSWCAKMEGAASADDRSGVIFTAELCVPWDAPEAVVDLDSAELVSLGPFPDKVGLFGRRKDAEMSRIMRGRDSRSIRFVVPDKRLIDRGFHDVTVVDMGDEREPTVVRKDMTRLREIWPPAVFDFMKWQQQDLELMRKAAKKDYQQNRPMPCRFCGKVIRVDMYRHVARLHLDLVQLWRCPIAWCTTWKGSPQDCLEHVRSGHDAPWVERTASVEQYAPPWTVHRQLWLDSLRVEHSGISTDMLLFSEVGLALTQHYRVYKGGLPHAVFCSDYLPRLRTLLPALEGAVETTIHDNGATPTSARRQHRVVRPKRLFPESAPVLVEQDPSAMAGATVFDCRPSLLPVSIPLVAPSLETPTETRPDATYQPLAASRGSIMDMDTCEISIDRIVGFSWTDPDHGTDVEDELPSPSMSPVTPPNPAAVSEVPVGTYARNVKFDVIPATQFRNESASPVLVTPVKDNDMQSSLAAADYTPPVIPDVLCSEAATSAVPGRSWDSDCVFSPVAEGSVTGGFMGLLAETDIAPLRDEVDFEIPPPVESPVTTHVHPGPDLSLEGPFDARDVDLPVGQSPLVMNSLAGCQYRMTSYDDRAYHNDTDQDPAYGIHMHDPRVIGYMGAPESARLMGRTPEYWLQHMGRERTIQAALRLHHDASLILTNIQVMSQLATSFTRAATEVMRVAHDRDPFPTSSAELVTPGRRVRRAAHYMAAMGLWRPTSAPVYPGPVSASSCNSCMACDDCFPDGGR